VRGGPQRQHPGQGRAVCGRRADLHGARSPPGEAASDYRCRYVGRVDGFPGPAVENPCGSRHHRGSQEEQTLIPANVQQQLKYVKVSSDRLSTARFPDFLIVGPQRTGTTWLHANLREHPEVFLAEPKELFFFSRLKTPENPRFESDELDWYLSFFHDPARRWLYKQWHSLRRYGRPYHARVRGEATASYAALDPDVIAEIAALRPDVKIVFSVRDPVDRAWSHAKKDLARNRGRKVSEVSNEEFEAFFRDPYQLRCARYQENLANWRMLIPEKNIFIQRFEAIEQSPEDLLIEVMKFLGVSTDPRYLVPELARGAVNRTGNSEVPERFRSFLGELLTEEVASWRRIFLSA